MAKQGTILVVDDNKAVLNALEMLLAGVFREVITIRTPNQIEAILESGRGGRGIVRYEFLGGNQYRERGTLLVGENQGVCRGNPRGFVHGLRGH